MSNAVSNAINLSCQCGNHFKVKPQAVGRQVRCPQCKTQILVSEHESGAPLPHPESELVDSAIEDALGLDSDTPPQLPVPEAFDLETSQDGYSEPFIEKEVAKQFAPPKPSENYHAANLRARAEKLFFPAPAEATKPSQAPKTSHAIKILGAIFAVLAVLAFFDEVNATATREISAIHQIYFAIRFFGWTICMTLCIIGDAIIQQLSD